MQCSLKTLQSKFLWIWNGSLSFSGSCSGSICEKSLQSGFIFTKQKEVESIHKHSENAYTDLQQNYRHTFSLKKYNNDNQTRNLHTGVHLSSRLLKIHSIQDVQVPTASEMNLKLQSHGCDVVSGFTCFKLACPFCKIVERKLFVNRTSGYHNCECKRVEGSWSSLHDRLSILKRGEKVLDVDKNDEENVIKRQDELNKGVTRLMGSRKFSEIDRMKNLAIKQLFQIEALTDATLDKLNIRVWEEDKSILLPFHDYSRDISAVKVLEMKKLKRGRQPQLEETTYPRLNADGLFGYQILPSHSKEVVLTASEFDAAAVKQNLQSPVLALPRRLLMLPQEILPMLEHFNKITLWFGNDVRSWEAARKFSKKLNSKRCHLIRPQEDLPAPLEALNMNLDLNSILKKSQPVSHKSIVSFQNLRQEVFRELTDTDQVAGVKWQRFPQLSNMLKGHRKGELTVFTGPTGSGKTTFISEYSLDLCMQGVNTLWGSFEIKNVRLAKIMLRQLSQLNLEQNMDMFDMWADKMELLPLYFLDFHGQQSIKSVVEAMTHAVYVHDIEHVIVDNLQFMVGTSDKTIADRFAVYDSIVATFRTFATRNNCHVTIVIHPRKERDSDELQTASIFGSAKASQEADNILILQDRRLTSLRGKKYIQIAKNRFDGDLGMVPLYFDKDSLCMSISAKAKTKNSVKQKKQDDDDSEVLGAKSISLRDIFIENEEATE